MFTCPDDPTVANGSNVRISYGMNYHLAMVGTGPTVGYIARFTTPESFLNAPASTVLLGEIEGNVANPASAEVESATIDCDGAPTVNPNWWLTEYTEKMATGYTPYTNATVMGGPDVAIHTGGSNWLAADYHAKWLPPTEVSGGYYESISTYSQADYDHPAGTDNITNVAGGKYVLTLNPK